MNILEFAKKVGVSKATVSNYLNNKTEKMSDKTREKIKEAIDHYGYIPNLGARHLCNQSNSKTIGIILEKTTLGSMFYTAFFSHIHQGINDIFQQYGYRALIIPEQDMGKTSGCLEYIKGLSRGLVDGFLLFNVQENDKYIIAFEKLNIPFMCFGQIQKPHGNNYVGSEHSNGIQIALQHFFEHGIKKVAISVGSSSSIVASQLKHGYMQFYKNQQVPVIEKYIISGKKDDSESIYEECLSLFKSDNPPTAFVVSRFQLDGLLAAANECKKIAGQDFFFILLNYFQVTEEIGKYSYIKAPIYDLGKAAAKKLIAQINGDSSSPQMFPMQLIRGNSCGCSGVRQNQSVHANNIL